MSRGVNFIVSIVLIVLAFIGLNCVLTKLDSYVVREGYIKTIEGETIKIIDTSGTMWEWEEEKEGKFNKWDNVKLIMDNNNTLDTLEDDVILRITIDN